MLPSLHESDRIESLQSYGILDTPDDPDYDDLTELAAELCGTPIALIALVDQDRTWFKSRYGSDVVEVPRAGSFCTDVVAAAAPVVIFEAAADNRFSGLEAVFGRGRVGSYAGVPLIGRDGLPLGALCVISPRPRRYSERELSRLKALARQVVTRLELDRLDHAMGWRHGPDDHELSSPVRLRAALDHGELTAHFQPIVELSTQLPIGYEALLRWEHPSRGLLLPGRYLPAIESSGLILPVGRQVLREAIRLLAELGQYPGGDQLEVAVNLSLAQLAHPGFADTVLSELDRREVAASRLSLELTESAALLDDRTAQRELQQLHETGVRLSIDDYGTGYSSLVRLLDLPISTLKLDRSLTQRLPHDRRALAVTGSTIDLAGDLGIQVVAEGIELPEQRDILVQLGCRYGQGFHFGAAIEASVLTRQVASMGAEVGAEVDGGAGGAADALASVAVPIQRWGVPIRRVPRWEHQVQVYDRESELTETVSQYLRPALRPRSSQVRPGAVLVVASAAHRVAFEAELRRTEPTLDALIAEGRYVGLDAVTTLAALMRKGRPDPERFGRVVSDLITELHQEHGFVRVYGEMVACLWAEGLTAAALILEDLWNEIAAEGTFSMFCAYPHGVLERFGDSEVRHIMRAQHTALVPGD